MTVGRIEYGVTSFAKGSQHTVSVNEFTTELTGRISKIKSQHGEYFVLSKNDKCFGRLYSDGVQLNNYVGKLISINAEMQLLRVPDDSPCYEDTAEIDVLEELERIINSTNSWKVVKLVIVGEPTIIEEAPSSRSHVGGPHKR
jgi:hypothetical protein